MPKAKPVEDVVRRPQVAAKVREMLAAIPSDCKEGGLTVRDVKENGSRVLIYWGSLPPRTDHLFRSSLKPYGYQVSIVRDPSQFDKYGTLREQ